MYTPEEVYNIGIRFNFYYIIIVLASRLWCTEFFGSHAILCCVYTTILLYNAYSLVLLSSPPPRVPKYMCLNTYRLDILRTRSFKKKN